MSLELVPTINTQVAYFEQSQLDELEKPLNSALIRERKGPGGKMLKYIKGSDAIAQANQIFGIGKWGYRVLSRTLEKSISLAGEVTGYFYTADVELYVAGCPFPFPGEGFGIVTPPKDSGVIIPEHHEKARKEATTDALKRALRHYGDQFGLCLYDEDSLVENESGDLVPVKSVHPSNARPAQSAKPKVVVDAVPAEQKSEEPPLTLSRVKMYAKNIGLAKDQAEWSLLLKSLYKRDVADLELKDSPAQLAIVYQALQEREKMQAKAATSGK